MWEPTDKLSTTLSYTLYNDKHNGGALKNIEDPNPDIREVTQDFPAKFKLRSELATLNVSYELPFATLKSVTSYQDMSHDQSFDADRLDLATYGGYDHVATWATEAETFMEELTISSLPESGIDWIAGVFYSNTDSAQYVVEYRELGVTSIPGLPVLPRDTTPAEIPSNLAYENISTVNRESVAPFFQATIPLMENLSATVGARYNDDKYDGEGASYYSTPTASSFATQTWTGKVGLDYDISEDSMVYASWSRGYKPGGLNGGTSGALVVSSTYDEETVEAIEFGSKNTFLDGRATFNASVFFNQYENMQFIEEDPIPYAGGIGNIPEAETYGIELEGSYLTFNDQLMLGGNMAMLDGEVTAEYVALDRRLADLAGDEAVNSGATYPWSYDWFLARQSAGVQVEGNTPPNLADLTYNLYAAWFQPIGDHGELTSRIENVYVGEYEARIFNTAGADDVPSYSLWNAYFQYQPNEAPWFVSASITNIGDEEGISGRFVDPYSSGTVSNEYVPPRQLLVTFGFEF